jgi:hypothetical protein
LDHQEGYTGPAKEWLPPKVHPPSTPIKQPAAARPFAHFFPDWIWGKYSTTPAPSWPVFDPPEGFWVANSPPHGKTFAVPSGVVYANETFSPRAATWRNASTGFMHVFHGKYWGNWIFEMKDHSPAESTIEFGAGGTQEARGSNSGGAFFVEGIREELDHPREYFVDLESNKLLLFYNATSGTKPQQGEVGE